MNDKDLLINSEMLRRNWGMDNISPLNIFPLVSERMDNLTILFFPMNKKLSGCCSKTDLDNIICINSSFSKGGQIVTLAHELYHILFDGDNEIFACTLNSKDADEKRADRFASYFLMPPVALNEFKARNNIDEWDFGDVIRCEQYFQISHSAMLQRLKSENQICDDQLKEFKKDVVENALNLGYNADLYVKSEKEYYAVGKIISLVELAYENDCISPSKRDSILLNVFRGDLAYNMIEEECGADLQ